jgi:hypothetical protein
MSLLAFVFPEKLTFLGAAGAADWSAFVRCTANSFESTEVGLTFFSTALVTDFYCLLITNPGGLVYLRDGFAGEVGPEETSS